MAFDAFCYFKGSDVSGETQDKTFSKEGAFEILSFEIGAENNINIGSISSGGGAGKATFKELTITKKTDSASCAMFSKLCEGNHFDEMVIELRRAGGSAGVSGQTFLKWQFALVMIQDISWSGSDGDDICEETVVIQYGAMKVAYTQQNEQGKKGSEYSGEWSRVLNTANLAVK
ncbi:Hcp family type VI secretion system effector [Pseudopelagicola sp. nBUS_19]|uniref:Hcp family type VI secretion system effector n=1 Tax=unclassified Pseudopelagicola TaxID=2649563 RepID=UPI003EB6B574